MVFLRLKLAKVCWGRYINQNFTSLRCFRSVSGVLSMETCLVVNWMALITEASLVNHMSTLSGRSSLLTRDHIRRILPGLYSQKTCASEIIRKPLLASLKRQKLSLWFCLKCESQWLTTRNVYFILSGSTRTQGVHTQWLICVSSGRVVSRKL